MTLTLLDLAALRRWVVASRAELAAQAEALNRLNVFPVPDGDTGSNLKVTLQGAVRELSHRAPQDLAESSALFSRALLMSARGNSGVILSQLLGGACDVAAVSGEGLDARGLARALREGSDRAVAGVSRPVDGTVLTVAAAAADGAEQRQADTLIEVCAAAVEAAREALLHTPDQLQVLRDAGVVDAGGAGYLLVLETLLRVVQEQPARTGEVADWLAMRAASPVVTSGEADAATDGCAADVVAADEGPAYEVMYLLEHSDRDRVARLSSTLDRLGDSVVVAGGPQLWSVHVHTDQVAAALDAGAAAGRPHRFSVVRFADEAPSAGEREPALTGVDVIAWVDGDGLAQLVRDRGGIPVSSVHELETALTGTDRDVLVLCDSGESQRVVAQERRRSRGECWAGGRHPVHVVSALDVVDREAGLDRAVDQVGTVEQDVSVTSIDSADSLPMLVPWVRRRLEGGGELVTVLLGGEAEQAAVDRALAPVMADHPDAELLVLPPGTLRQGLALGVE